MNTIFTLLISMVTCGLFVNPSSEVAEIEKTLNYYLEGETAEEVGRAFREEAALMFVRDGVYEEVSAGAFLDRIRGMEKPERKTRIRSIQVTGHAASACVEQEYKTHTNVDYINLLKIEGNWKIVNKVFDRMAREASPN